MVKLLVQEDGLDVHVLAVLVQEVGQKRAHRRRGDVSAHHDVPLALLPLEASAELPAGRQDVHDLRDEVREQRLNTFSIRLRT